MRLLIVDDEAAQMRALCDTLEDNGFNAVGFSASSQALEALRAERFDLVLTDLMMPEMDGIELLRRARTIDPDVVGVLMTGHGTLDTAVDAMKAGALDYILKPFKLREMIPVIERALQVRRLRIEKASAIAELESFSYSVSHDLRAPLRIVSGYTEILLSDHLAELSEDAQRMLKSVRAGAQRMDALINDLLRLSRLGREPLQKEPVDLGAIARDAFAELTGAAPAPAAQLVIADFPPVAGDAGLLMHVFSNLLSNALKFTRERETPRIDVGWQDAEDGALEVFVKDNGAGFDMRYAPKLFRAFQRLHGAERFEGTGIGLSIVKRVIDRHGGQVRVEAEPDKGATFRFTLPRQ